MSQDDDGASKQPVNYQVLIPQEYYGGHQDDEISLIELFLILWRKKIWIIGLSSAITIMSIFYAYSLKPVYLTKTYLLPPQGKDIAVLNLFVVEKEGKPGKLHTIDSVYKLAIDNLKSRQYQWLFFSQNNLINLYGKKAGTDVRPRDVFNDSFHTALKIEDKKDEQMVSFKYGDKQEAVRVLNQFIAFINKATVKSLLGEVIGGVQFERQQIEQQIEQLRQDAIFQRQDKIQQIKEQIQLARKLNIHTSKLSGVASVSADGKELSPHYAEGTKALQGKLDALSSRKSDDPYISELRPLQARLTVLNKATIDEKQVKAFNIDQEALEPKYPIKPNKRQIAIFGFILGLMLSVFAVFLWHFIEKYREQHSC